MEEEVGEDFSPLHYKPSQQPTQQRQADAKQKPSRQNPSSRKPLSAANKKKNRHGNTSKTNKPKAHAQKAVKSETSNNIWNQNFKSSSSK